MTCISCFCVLSAFLSVVSSLSAGVSENATDYQDCDVGNPITGVQSAADCRDLCTADPDCFYWTLWESGQTCYKKWAKSGRRSLDDHISGPSGPSPPTSHCQSDLNCSLNGVCGSDGKCACDKPWIGVSCGQLKFAVTQVAAKHVHSGSWGAPVIGPVDGNYHMYLQVGSSLLNCISPDIEGSWNCSTEIKGNGYANPAAIMYKDPATGKTMFLLWVAGQDPAVSQSPWGPFTQMPDSKPPDTSNPSVIFHNGAFYYTTQHAKTLWTTPALDQPWTKHGDINFWNPGTREDAFLWVDKRGNFHVIGHAYDTIQKTNCSSSLVSDHGFSPDGKTWYSAAPLEPIGPYTHTVEYDDGSSQVYSTMERPALHFNANGQPTHLTNGAEYVAGDEGCRPTACVDCKYNWANSGTIVTKLDIEHDVSLVV